MRYMKKRILSYVENLSLIFIATMLMKRVEIFLKEGSTLYVQNFQIKFCCWQFNDVHRIYFCNFTEQP